MRYPMQSSASDLEACNQKSSHEHGNLTPSLSKPHIHTALKQPHSLTIKSPNFKRVSYQPPPTPPPSPSPPPPLNPPPNQPLHNPRPQNLPPKPLPLQQFQRPKRRPRIHQKHHIFGAGPVAEVGEVGDEGGVLEEFEGREMV